MTKITLCRLFAFFGVNKCNGDISTMMSPDAGDEDISVLCNFEQTVIVGVGMLVLTVFGGTLWNANPTI